MKNRNKRETAIRLIHKKSGIIPYCADEREQGKNLKKAFKNLINKKEFQKWLKFKKEKKNGNNKIPKSRMLHCI